ncbi:trace amine-associated receptor 1-like [Dunckerocampus dactyliophorus]|uniref:trace amine-associated receptor 1-like n=1 Tax=Dunckerocampus dactyliophorus TaxID=161453 RepID=UPI002404FC95|nr:trace amine-associated receptor 1-like [Dunckerocampus dactyliophorus]
MTPEGNDNSTGVGISCKPYFSCVLLRIFPYLISVVITCGNLLIIISVIYFRQLHTPTNYLILSLAVSDLFVGVLVIPLSREFTHEYCMTFGNLICIVQQCIRVTLTTASILNLCCISIDRYYAVYQPLTYRVTINDHIVVVMILLSWGLSFLLSIGFVVAELNYAKCGEKCYIDTFIVNISGPIFTFYIPMSVMICFYVKIFFVAQKQARSIQNTTYHSRTPGETVSKMERKATKTLAIVMGAFIICCSPVFIFLMIFYINQVSVPFVVMDVISWMVMSNSMVNPFIYAFFYSWYRSAFKIIISGKIFQGHLSITRLK